MANKTNLLLIYTGGTIGMIQDTKTQSLVPFNFRNLTEQVPELSKFDIQLSSIAFEKPIDSSNMHPGIWIKLAEVPPSEQRKNNIKQDKDAGKVRK